MVRSSRLLRSVFKQQEELQQKRAEAERKMEQLVEVQRQVSMLECNNEVWGPADPDHMLVKKYRRLWLERPVNFPLRKDGAKSVPSSPKSTGRASAPPSPKNVAAEATTNYSEQDHLFGIPAPPSTQGTYHLPQSVAREPRPPELERLAAELATVKPRDQAVPAHTCEPLSAPFDSPFASRASPQAPQASPYDEFSSSRPGSAGATSEPFVQNSSPKFGGGPQESPQAPHFGSPNLSSEPIQFRNAVMGITLERSSVTKPLPGFTGADWNESQWTQKALEIATSFLAEEEGWGLKTNLQDPPELRPDSPKGGELSPRTPPAVSRGLLNSGGTLLPLLATCEDSGLDVIPDWYLALDRIYETTDMVKFCTPPIPVCADKSIVNSPGHSYAIGKKTTVPPTPSRRVGDFKNGNGSYTAPPRPPAPTARPIGAATAPAGHLTPSTGRMPTPKRATTPTRRPR